MNARSRTTAVPKLFYLHISKLKKRNRNRKKLFNFWNLVLLKGSTFHLNDKILIISDLGTLSIHLYKSGKGHFIKMYWKEMMRKDYFLQQNMLWTYYIFISQNKLSSATAGYKDCTCPLLNCYTPTKVSNPYQVWFPLLAQKPSPREGESVVNAVRSSLTSHNGCNCWLRLYLPSCNPCRGIPSLIASCTLPYENNTEAQMSQFTFLHLRRFST